MILPEHEAKELLEKAHIPVVPTKTVNSLEEAEKEARKRGYPVVMKLSTGRFSHKTDIGAVYLNIQDEQGLQKSYSELVGLRDKLDRQAAVIIEPMAPEGAEFFIGIQRHESFGPVMTMGLGGVWLELFKDVAFRLLPATRSDFREMLFELKGWPKLKNGFRNLPPVEPENMLRLMERIGDFVLKRDDILEMDLNPIMAYPDRALVVDARMVTRS